MSPEQPELAINEGVTSPDNAPSDVAQPRPKKRANDLEGTQWTRNSISIWDDIRKTDEEKRLKHPAMFPTQLATRLISTFTRDFEKNILDPFSGVGSTVLAAESLGKTGIGIDISEEFTDIARARPVLQRDMFSDQNLAIGERKLIVGDSTKLADHVGPSSIDFALTSPPYWDILTRVRSADSKPIRNYGDSGTDLGRIPEYEEFLESLVPVFSQVYEALRQDKYLCVVVMDIRKKNQFYPFHADLAAKLETIGFTFDDLIIWDRRHEYNNLRPLGYPAVFRINKTHEYVLIFQKR